MKTNKIYGFLSFAVVLIAVFLFSTIFVQAAKPDAFDSKNNQAGTSTPSKRGNADIHRSTVSIFVKNLLDVANETGDGIGDEVRVIAQEQNDAKEKVSSAIDAIESRGGFKAFLIGTDYKNIGMIRSEMVKTQASIDKLNRAIEKMPTSTVATTSQEILNLTQEQERLNNFIKQNESKFSLFGWFAKLFNK